MKASDRRILLVIAALAAVAAFYFLALAPKRTELSELKTDVESAQQAAQAQEQLAAAAAAAKGTYRRDYQHLVVLGKAVPGDDDVSSLLDQVNGLAGSAGIRFNSLTLAASDASPAAPAPEAPAPAEPSEPAPAPEVAAVPASAPAPATEMAAAALPLGAAVGAAGLPTMPYDLTFTGDFFDIADFLAGLDGMVELRDQKGLAVEGRLLTIDGFSLQAAASGFPKLNANLYVTSYVAPADQGLTAGATPAAPAAAASTSPGAVPAAPVAATAVGAG